MRMRSVIGLLALVAATTVGVAHATTARLPKIQIVASFPRPRMTPARVHPGRYALTITNADALQHNFGVWSYKTKEIIFYSGLVGPTHSLHTRIRLNSGKYLFWGDNGGPRLVFTVR